MKVSLNSPSTVSYIEEVSYTGRASVWMQEMIINLTRTLSNLKSSSLKGRATLDTENKNNNAWHVFYTRVTAFARLTALVSIKFESAGPISSFATELFKSQATSFEIHGKVLSDRLQRISSTVSTESSFVEKILSLWEKIIQTERLS